MRFVQFPRVVSILALSACFLPVSANNIQVTNVSLTDQNTTSHFTMVEFDISWENSWRLAGGPSNWDAAWVFVKYRVGAGPWLHAYLNDEGHVAPAGSTIEIGLVDEGGQYNPPTNPAVGVFIFRSTAGSGTFSLANVKLRWNYGDNGVDDDAVVDVKVFAIEHVLVPEGAYYLGSGGNEAGHFYTYTPLQEPYQVTGDGEIPVGAISGNLYYDNPFGDSGDQQGPIPVGFPEGFKAFYIMKYEISQQAYVDCLNTLTRSQQAGMVNIQLYGGGPYQPYAMSDSGSPDYRNGIRKGNDDYVELSPVTFFCDLNNNGLPGDPADGGTIACNWLYWKFLAGYLDWAALRPITELEFEKAARGPVSPVPSEYVWGSVFMNSVSVIYDSGKPTEIPDSLANCTQSQNSIGPLRCGAFARPGSSRESAGAGYYGAMNLGDNVSEATITVGLPEGRAFDGIHGDGILDSNGSSDVVHWPGITAVGSGYRGGNHFEVKMTSDRAKAAGLGMSPIPPNARGGRGGRTRSL